MDKTKTRVNALVSILLTDTSLDLYDLEFNKFMSAYKAKQ